jgi:hypothetical protein
VGLVFGIVILVGLALSFSAYRALSTAKHSMDAARIVIDQDISNKQVFESKVGRAALAANIQSVLNDVKSASVALHSSFGLRILGKLPYLSDQRNGIVNLVNNAGTTAATGSILLQRVNALVDQSSGTTVSLTALQALQQSMVQARLTLTQLNQPVGDLVGPLGTARRDFDNEIVKITGDLSRGNQTISYVLPFLGADGPRTYLVMGENNAEMRDQGLALSYAVMHASGGNFSIDTTGSVDTIEPKTPVDVPVPPDTEVVFGGYQPTLLWQSVNATADFPFSAQAMQAMFSQVVGTHVNGVIALDVPALQSLLNLTGPVSVPNIAGIISAGNVANVLLHEEYAQIPARAPETQTGDNVAAVARATVDRIQTEHIDLAALANALATDVEGRHLIVWDEVPRFESTLSALGASGAIDTADPDRTFHVAVENSTGTKLDYYVEVALNVRVDIDSGGNAKVYTTVTVDNTTPAGTPPSFQVGPDDNNSVFPGQYVGRVVVWSPRGSKSSQGISESGLELAQTQVSVLPQKSQSVVFGTLIPHAVVNGQFRLRYVPQPRLYPDGLKIEISAPGWKVGGSPNVDQPLDRTTEFAWTVSR